MRTDTEVSADHTGMKSVLLHRISVAPSCTHSLNCAKFDHVSVISLKTFLDHKLMCHDEQLSYMKSGKRLCCYIHRVSDSIFQYG